jgi:hypothetical protein
MTERHESVSNIETQYISWLNCIAFQTSQNIRIHRYMRRKINHKNIGKKPLKEVCNYKVKMSIYFIIHILYPFQWQATLMITTKNK